MVSTCTSLLFFVWYFCVCFCFIRIPLSISFPFHIHITFNKSPLKRRWRTSFCCPLYLLLITLLSWHFFCRFRTRAACDFRKASRPQAPATSDAVVLRHCAARGAANCTRRYVWKQKNKQTNMHACIHRVLFMRVCKHENMCGCGCVPVRAYVLIPVLCFAFHCFSVTTNIPQLTMILLWLPLHQTWLRETKKRNSNKRENISAYINTFYYFFNIIVFKLECELILYLSIFFIYYFIY